jgi:hypothetical protein
VSRVERKKTERKETVMKKMYIKPAAVNVAFSVNENIAVSLGSIVYGDFTVQMTEVTQGKCQQYLSGNHDLWLGLDDDEAADFFQLMTLRFGPSGPEYGYRGVTENGMIQPQCLA